MNPTTWRLVGIALCILGSCFGCATARPIVTVEAPRELAPSATHVFTAPVHETTDLTVGYQAVDTDADAGPAAVATDAGGEDAPTVQEKASHGF